MKTKMVGLFIVMFLLVSQAFSQDVTTVEAKSDDISDNLDLEAVASVFGESKDLEDFERRLNDPEMQITNLDLNEDGEVDYLRVVETSEGDAHLIAIQAVIGEDQYQDVATVEVEKDSQGETQVQVVGDVYLYGPNYIIEPVYVRPPLVVTFFWSPLYRPWRSPYRYRYYPPHYHPWHPHPPHVYRRNVNVHVNVNNTYHHTTVRKSKTTVNLHNNVRRNDYAKKHPDKSFTSRNKGVSNKYQLNQNKKNANASQSATMKQKATTTKKQATTTKQQATTTKKQATTTKQQATTTKKQATTTKQQATTTKKQATTTKQQTTTTKKQATTVKKQTTTTRNKQSVNKNKNKKKTTVAPNRAAKKSGAKNKNTRMKKGGQKKTGNKSRPASRPKAKPKANKR